MKKNPFDLMFEQVLQASAKTDYSKIAENPKAVKMYIAIVRKLGEMHDLKRLFKQDFLPAVERSIIRSKGDLYKSKYKNIILENMAPEDMRENYHETVRLGYVALYHKYENFNTALIKEVDEYFEEIYEKKESVKAFAKREFGIDKWPKITAVVDKVRWVCNSIKHKDGFPIQPVHIAFSSHPLDARLLPSKDDLMRDLDDVSEYCRTLITYVISVGMLKVLMDSVSDPDQEEIEKIADAKSKIIHLGNLMEDY